MGIDSVAIKTFNSTGSQSVCRANEADETRLIESEFLTKCTTQYINGSGMSFMSGTINLGTLRDSSPTETFTLPSDVDAISEITLQMKLGPGAFHLSPTFLLDMIKKIEIKLGNLVVQTILPGDIYSRNLTEFGNIINSNTFHRTTVHGYYVFSDDVDFSVSVPFTGRSTGVNKCFLQAGAITNALTMKVYYNVLPQGSDRLIMGSPGYISTGVCVFSHSITSTEKNFIAKNIINRPVNTSQSVVSAITSTTGSLTIDLSTVNINVSHILLNLNNSLFSSSGTAAAIPAITLDEPEDNDGLNYPNNPTVATGHAAATLDKYTLTWKQIPNIFQGDKLFLSFGDTVLREWNGEYTVGDDGVGGGPVGVNGIGADILRIGVYVKKGAVLPSPLVARVVSRVEAGTTWGVISDMSQVRLLGVAAGWLGSAELILGNDRTGNIPGSCLTTNKLELFKLTSVASNKNIYILKTADSAFSTAGIPFSRLNNKKLVITFAPGFNIDPYQSPSLTGATNINVTCCGTQVQSTVGGSISFSA